LEFSAVFSTIGEPAPGTRGSVIRNMDDFVKVGDPQMVAKWRTRSRKAFMLAGFDIPMSKE